MIRGVFRIAAMSLVALTWTTTVTLAIPSGVPDPRFSTFTGCLRTCPAGDLTFLAIIRDVSNAPLAGIPVVLHLEGCPSAPATLCADCAQPSGYDPVGKTFTRVTDANGKVTFDLCGTIFCPSLGGRWVGVSALGIQMGNVSSSGPDVDHDLDVDAADVALVTAALGSVNQGLDQDCVSTITQADVDAVTAHLGHHCIGAVPALDQSWGSLKVTYR